MIEKNTHADCVGGGLAGLEFYMTLASRRIVVHVEFEILVLWSPVGAKLAVDGAIPSQQEVVSGTTFVGETINFDTA